MTRRRTVDIIAFTLVLTLAAYLRLVNNADNPGWYADEGTHVIIARHLAHGRIQYMAVGESTLLFAKLPLFEMLLALLFRIGGEGIATLRILTGVLGVITVGVLYGVIRYAKGDRSLALLAALMLAIYPQAVLYSRFGFSYNLLAPLVLVALLGFWGYTDEGSGRGSRRRSWLACASLAIGIGSVSDLWMLSLVVPLIGVVLTCRWRDLRWSIALVLLPFCMYAFLMLVRSPQAFLFDLGFTFSRLSKLAWSAQIKTLALNYAILVSESHWVALALVGMFLLRPARLQRLSLLLFLLPIVIVGRTEALFNLSAYYTIPLLPLISLGVANLLKEGVPHAVWAIEGALLDASEWLAELPRWWKRSHVSSLAAGMANVIVAGVVLSPFVTSTIHSVGQVRHGFSTKIDPFLINPHDARCVAEYVNARTSAEDVVIASPGLAWALDSNTADFQMSVAFRGQATPHLPATIAVDRLAYEPDYREAHFVVVDNVWRNWGVYNVAGLSQAMDELESWPLALECGAIRVYCNARTRDCTE